MMIRNATPVLKAVLLAVVFCLALPGGSRAQGFIATYGDWNAFQDGKGNDRVCYIASLPKSTAPANVNRGKTYILVTHRPADKARNVFEFRAGYPYKDGAEVDLAIDGNKPIKLFTKDDAAWARDSKTDTEIAEAMKRGRSLTVIGVSARGTKTTDTYSLSGVTAALEAIDKACK